MVDLAELTRLREAEAAIRYRRSADDWVADGELLGFRATARARTLAAVRGEVLRLLADLVNQQWWSEARAPRGVSVLIPGHVSAVDDVELPARCGAAVRKARRLRVAARESADRAAEALSDAALALDAAGFSLRDAGEVLELSHARVAQILEHARSRTQEEQP